MRLLERITVIIPPALKDALRADSEKSMIGISGIARQILVEHYEQKGKISL